MNLREHAFELLKSQPDQRFKAREIAEWIHCTYPAETLDKMKRSSFLETEVVLLTLQLYFGVSFVVGLGGGSLMSPPPQRPGDNKGGGDGRPDEEASEEIADFGHRRQQRLKAAQAAIGWGLVWFDLPWALMRNWAESLARNAAAAMTRLMWRCHPCQERASQ